MGLLGKILPLQVKDDPNNPAIITNVTHIIVDSNEPAKDQTPSTLNSQID